MEQFYYTVCRDGKSVSGQNGFQVRAISPGLNPDTVLMTLAGSANYAPPWKTTADRPDSVADAPVRLAFLVTAEQRMLVHACFAGEDAEGRERLGNFFTHAIVGLPESVDPLHLLSAWGSPQWARHNDDGPTVLPVPRSLPCDGTLDEKRLTAFLKTQVNRDHLATLIAAFLMAKPYQQLTLVGRDEDVALLIYGLLLCLPPSTRKAVTFSTYEQTPESAASNTRVVGTALPPGQTDVEERWYRESGSAINLTTARRSEVPKSFFAAWMMHLLCTEGIAALNKQHNSLEARGIIQNTDLELLARLNAPGGQVNTAEYTAALQTPAIAKWALEKESACGQIAALLLGGSDEKQPTLRNALVTTIGNDPSLAKNVRPAILAAWRERMSGNQSDAEKSINRLEGLWPLLKDPCTAAVASWQYVAQSHAATIAAPLIPVRLILIEWWCRDPTAENDAALQAVVQKWLTVSPRELTIVLTSKAAAESKVLTLIAVLRAGSDISDELGKILIELPADLHRLLCQQLAERPDLRRQYNQLLTRWTSSNRSADALDELMHRGAKDDRESCECLLAQSLKNEGVAKLADQLKQRIPEMIAILPTSPSVAEICTHVVSTTPPTEALLPIAPGAIDLLGSIVKASDLPLERALKEKSVSLKWLRERLSKPLVRFDTDSQTLERFAKAMEKSGVSADPAARTMVWKHCCNCCAADEEFEAVLCTLGPSPSDDLGLVLSEIISLVSADKALQRNIPLLNSTCLIALGAATHSRISADIARHPELAFDVTKLAQMLPAGSFKAVDKKTKNWPDVPRAVWETHTKMIRPQPVIKRAIDISYGLSAGVVIGAALLLVFKTAMIIIAAAFAATIATAALDWLWRRMHSKTAVIIGKRSVAPISNAQRGKIPEVADAPKAKKSKLAKKAAGAARTR
jgi:hypothetical protein